MSHKSTRLIVLVVLYISRIYDPVRRGYILSKRSLPMRIRDRQEQVIKIIVGDRAYNVGTAQPGHVQVGAKTSSETLPFAAAAESRATSADAECPVPDMHPLVRFYERFTLVMGIVILVECAIVCCAHLNWIDKILICYAPGRSDGILGRYSRPYPVCALAAVALYLSYRLYAYCAFDHLDLDCFPFLMCGEGEVLDKESRLGRLRSMRSERKAAEAFVANSMFYRQVRRSDGRTEYAMKPHRSVGQLRRLRKFVNDQLRGQMVAGVVYLCLSVWCTVDMFTDEAFNLRYAGCHVFATYGHMDAAANSYRWSLRDPYRLLMLLMEIVDTYWLMADLYLVLVFTVESGVIVTSDLSYRLGDICDRLDALNNRLARYYHFNGHIHIYASQLGPADESLEDAILAAQEDLVDAFERVSKCDRFIKGFSASHMFYWFACNLT